MFIDDFRIAENGDRLERSARVRWDGGEFRLAFAVPAAFAPRAEDAAPFLAATLLQAMCRREDLEIDAPVSAAFLSRSDLIQRIYHAWDPSLRPCQVSAAETADASEPQGGRASFFSRGVDSMFSVATSTGDAAITHLVFVQGLDPIQDPEVRNEDYGLAREVAELLGLPLIPVWMNLRTMADPLVDWADLFGAGLSALGHCLGGGLGSIVIPSSADYSSQGPCGSSPLLDPLFSTESVEVVHGTIAYNRAEKVATLAAQRPDLLPYLKVCYHENRVDNCGRCRKCLWTMVCLEAAAALSDATSFPDQIPVDRIRNLRIADYALRIGWMQALHALPIEDRTRALRDALTQCLHRSARPSVGDFLRAAIRRLRGKPHGLEALWSTSNIRFYREQTNLALALLRRGEPHRPSDLTPPDPSR